jgi:hypothetical protein
MTQHMINEIIQMVARTWCRGGAAAGPSRAHPVISGSGGQWLRLARPGFRWDQNETLGPGSVLADQHSYGGRKRNAQ